MLTIRLQRAGKKNQADFRIVLAEKHAPVTKKILEILGNYNPRKKTFKIKEERLKELLAQNTQLSPTVNNLLILQNLLQGKKVQAFKIKKKKAPTLPSAGADTSLLPAGEAKVEDKPKEASKPEEEKAEAVAETPEEKKEEARQ